MASEHDSSAHSRDHESVRKRDRFLRYFKSNKSTITTNAESQVPKSEQTSKKDLEASSSKSESSRQVLLDSRNSSIVVDQTQSLQRTEDKINHETTNDDGSQSQYLWMRAYKALENRDPDLVAAYACYLDPARSSSTRPANLSPKLIEAVIDKKLQDNEAKKLVFHFGAESIKVREQGEKIIKFILWSNSFISAAVSAQPYAALAWSGVSVLLPLLLNSSKQKEAMLTGLNSITDLLRLYKIREELYLQGSDIPAHPDFVKAIEELYTDIFEYQARLSLYLSQIAVKRAIQSTFEWDDWNGMLKRVQTSDARCTKYTALLDKDKEHQFYTEQSSQIEQSIEVQKRILEMFEASQDARRQDRQDDQEAALLRALASDYESDKDLVSTRVPGTCEWVFKDERFLEWRNRKYPSLLWISAGPGCGKSVLSRCLIDEKLLCTNVMTSTVCYFFFKDGQEKRSTGFNAISAILHQLFEKKSGSSLLSHGLSGHRKFGELLRDTFSELWNILIKSAKNPDAGEIVCVLDALDECEEHARKQLVKKLVDFFANTDFESSCFTLKFLITSRPYEDLELGFEPISSTDAFIHFDSDDKSEKIGQEINLVIDAKVPRIAGDFSAEDRKSITDRLKRLDNRTYLWLFLTMDIIESSRSKYGKMSSIDELLSSLPPSVSDAYEKILSRSSDKDKAKALLQIVVAARRPLTLEEANIALSIATQRESCKSLKTLGLWPSTSFKSIIQNICGLLISVYDSKIFLIHQTAREFLVSSSKSHATSSREWEGSFNMNTAHGTVSQICLHYLNLQEFASMTQWQLAQDNDTQIIREESFHNYAAKEWPFHYTSQDSELAQSSRKAAGMLCKPSLNQISHWAPIYCDERSLTFFFFSIAFLDHWAELGIASHLGLSYVVEDFLNEGADLNFVNGAGEYGTYGTALTVASIEGHEKIVELLLYQNADVHAENEYFGTALTAAASHGHGKIVEMLLNQNADVDAVSGHYGTALIAAAEHGHEKIVEMLLNQNANVNIENEIFGTALITAARNGLERIVEMLLNQNADVNAQGEFYGNALMTAAENGHERIVETLLNQHSDVNAETKRGDTALIWAAAGGHKRIVRMLLNQNELLLKGNRDIDFEGETYRKALKKATRFLHTESVEILLNKVMESNVGVEAYRNALDVALRAAGLKPLSEEDEKDEEDKKDDDDDDVDDVDYYYDNKDYLQKNPAPMIEMLQERKRILSTKTA